MTDQSELVFASVAAVLSTYDPQNRLDRYFELLHEENRRVNLVSRETTLAGMKKLAAESLIPFAKVPPINVESYIDVGSGGGFPAIPILLTHDIKGAVLVERTAKKAAALRRLLLGLELKAEIIDKSFEEITFREKFDLLTVRQVKLSRLLLGRLMAVLKAGGILICFAECEKGLDESLTDAATFCSSISNEHSRMTFTVVTKK